MKLLLSLFAIFFLTSVFLRAEDPTPPPAELTTLAQTLITVLKADDAAAIAACWHSPEALAKLKEAEALAASGTSPTEINVAKEREKELKRREKDLTRNKQRIDEIRTLIAKHFGSIFDLKFVSLEVEPDVEATDPTAAFDDVELHLLAADGTKLHFEIDDALRIDGIWKFKGRVEDKLSIELSDP